jgi:glycosyltransferase involved in cell wall biosynthesis
VLNSTDLFVLASHSDPFALVLLEALDAGCPIVATAVDGTPEMLEHGAAGILVPPRDPSALAAAIGSVLQDRDKQRALRAASIRRSESFSVAFMCEEYMKIYASQADARSTFEKLSAFWPRLAKARNRRQHMNV